MNEVTLTHGDYQASVIAHGATLRTLKHRGRDVVVPFDEDQRGYDYRGIIAAPWPNRIADGRYTFEGEELQLPINDPEHSCALHGLVFDEPWQLINHTKDSVCFSFTLQPSSGYPFRLELLASYRLDNSGLSMEVTTKNTGTNNAPYGLCPHPYLVAGPGPLDEWTLQVPANNFLQVSEDRLLPVDLRSLQGHPFDFRAPRPIGETRLDHAFTGLNFDAQGQVQLTVWDPVGTGAGIAWDQQSRWVQVHTADRPTPLPHRVGLAVEPMTCPPDAFNSGTDLVVLAPGDTLSVAWRIFALDSPTSPIRTNP